MKRFLFVLLVVGVTRACQPAPPPPSPADIALNKQSANIKLVTIVDYDKEKVPQYMGYFPATHIEQYSNKLGKFANLSSADVDGNFAFTFSILHTDCDKVSQWMKEVVEKGQYYKNAPVECIHNQTTPTEPKTTAEETATATTAQSQPMVPEAATEEEETNTKLEPKTTAEETATATTPQSRPVVPEAATEEEETNTKPEPKTTAEETATATTPQSRPVVPEAATEQEETHPNTKPTQE